MKKRLICSFILGTFLTSASFAQDISECQSDDKLATQGSISIEITGRSLHVTDGQVVGRIQLNEDFAYTASMKNNMPQYPFSPFFLLRRTVDHTQVALGLLKGQRFTSVYLPCDDFQSFCSKTANQMLDTLHKIDITEENADTIACAEAIAQKVLEIARNN